MWAARVPSYRQDESCRDVDTKMNVPVIQEQDWTLTI